MRTRSVFVVCSLAVISIGACGRSTDEGDDEVGEAGTDTEESGVTGSGDAEAGTTAGESGEAEAGSTTDTSTETGTETETETGTTSESETGETGMETGETGETGMETGETGMETGETGMETGETGMETGETGNECLRDEIVCDGLDDDCNGLIDDVDVGNDGFCDCYRIGIIGTAGSNPASNFEVWLEEKGTTADRFGTAADHQLVPEDLENFDLLIVDRLTHVYPPEQRDILQTWVEDGHGLISMAGYANDATDRDRQNSLVGMTGLTYETPIYISPTEEWQVHPITENATSVQVYGGWRVQGSGEVFVRPAGEPNNSLGTTTDVGEGTVIVFSDEWISFDSEWDAIPEVENFWSNMVNWVGPEDLCFEPQ